MAADFVPASFSSVHTGHLDVQPRRHSGLRCLQHRARNPMATRITPRHGASNQPEGPIPATRGDPRSIIVLAVVGGLVAMIIIVWIWLG
jgi:hypothetical protein